MISSFHLHLSHAKSGPFLCPEDKKILVYGDHVPRKRKYTADQKQKKKRTVL